ncbi:head maturation protease, ClpP-related [Microvirga vignae]|uniref:head maturation protease, ClpP-related n=1 Tax=Microvirga vignae TaxID=1225564 RepID=UPI000AD73BF9|nr:head maturation protease, ClpP-related [Microvirga vignae]
MPILIAENEITLIGVVGGWSEEGFDAAGVITALAMLGRETDITVRLNSGGGIATEGAAIHAALKSHKGKVAIVIEGIAASAASIIALGGTSVTARPGAVFMIHDPAGLTFGNAADHAKTIEALNTLGDAYAGIYADKTGKSAKAMRELMRAETWMTAEEAVKVGFIDKVDGGEANDNKPAEASAFDYKLYAKAPAALVALAQARGWERRAAVAFGLPTPAPKPPAPPADPARERAEAITALCAEVRLPEMAAGLIASDKTMQQVQAWASDVRDIRTRVALAAKLNPKISASLADKFIAEGNSPQQVGEILLSDVIDDQSPEIVPAAPSPASATAAQAGWDKAVARINANNGFVPGEGGQS